MNNAPGFAYVFERFPSFTQTFCAREVGEWARLGFSFPIFSINSVAEEEVQHFPVELYQRTVTVPEDVDLRARRWWTPFSWRSRKIKQQIQAEWGAAGGRRRAAEAAWLGPRLRALGVRHIHVHFAGLAARTAFWLHRVHGITYSITAHANDFLVDGPGQFLEEVFREAKFVVTVSDFSVARLEEKYPFLRGRIHRVYNGIDMDSFPRAEVGTETGAPIIVSVGRYIEKKGFPDLIEACSRLRDLDFTCQIIGQGPLEPSLRGQIERLGLQDRVVLTGPRSEAQIRRHLAGAHVFALACCREKEGGMDNLPTVIMEAMAAGVPVISTRLAGVPEMVVDQETGLLVEPNDVDGLAAALRELLQSPTRRKTMGQAGHALGRARFDLSVTSRELHRVFHKHGVCPAVEVNG